MKSAALTSLVVALLVGGCSKSSPPPAANPGPPHATKTYPLGKLGALTLTYPLDWKVDSIPVKETRPNLSMTFDGIRFMPTNGSNFAMLVELVPVDDAHAAQVDLKSVLLRQGAAELSNSAQTSFNIIHLKGDEVTGEYFQITDKRWTNTPPPGEFKRLTQGYARLGTLILSFRIVANDDTNEPPALDVIRTARLAKP